LKRIASSNRCQYVIKTKRIQIMLLSPHWIMIHLWHSLISVQDLLQIKVQCRTFYNQISRRMTEETRSTQAPLLFNSKDLALAIKGLIEIQIAKSEWYNKLAKSYSSQLVSKGTVRITLKMYKTILPCKAKSPCNLSRMLLIIMFQSIYFLKVPQRLTFNLKSNQ
jgi:hypothetical protein